MPAASVEFVLTDPPYIVRYRDRQGRTVANDNNADWLAPAFAHMDRVLKQGSFCVSFYGWIKADLFIQAWHAAGFRGPRFESLCAHHPLVMRVLSHGARIDSPTFSGLAA